MTNFDSKNRVEDIPPTHMSIANGHEASICSVMGEHTPGANSDSIYVNTAEADDAVNKYPKLLGLVCDGMSGNVASQHALGGQFAARYFTSELPQQWELAGQESFFEFNECIIDKDVRLAKYSDLYFWLIRVMKLNNDQAEMIREILTWHKNIFIIPEKGKFDKELYVNKTAADVAKMVFRDEQEVLAVLRLMVAMYRTTRNMQQPFMEKFDREIEQGKEIEAMTTLTGVVELPEHYLTFGVGDSRTFILDELGINTESLTSKFSQGSMLTSCAGCLFENNAVAVNQPTCHGVSINFVKKASLYKKNAVVSLTDGFGVSDAEIQLIGQRIQLGLNDTQIAIEAVMNDAMLRDEAYKLSSKRYLSDDKTIVIIHKAA